MLDARSAASMIRGLRFTAPVIIDDKPTSKVVELDIDERELYLLALKAIRSKGQKAKAHPIRLKVLK